MPFAHGSDAVLTIGAGATDISAYLESIDANFERDEAEINPLGGTWGSSIPGLRRLSGSVSGYFDPTLDTELWNAWNGDTDVAFAYYPQGDATGLPKYSGNMRVSNYRISTPSGDAGKVSFDFGSQGAITKGTA